MPDNIPWMIGGDVEHAVEDVRTATYVAIGGREGVVGPADLRVTALPGQGPGVSVAPGAFGILASQAPYEAYAGRHLAAETAAISATGSSARTDLVIARIEDPFYDGSPYPNPDPLGSDPVARQAALYWRVRVIANVPASTTSVAQLGLGLSAIALARVTQPANSSSVSQAMITDLRPQQAVTDVPIGAIFGYPAYTPPSNYLVIDGSGFSSTTYPSLAALVGDQFFGHSGTTYYLPDLRRRVLVGDGPSLGIGANEGIGDPAARSFSHTHSVPDHAHSIPPHGHTGGVDIALATNDNTATSGQSNSKRVTNVTAGLRIDPTGLQTNGSGGSTTGAALGMPHVAGRYIIKAA